MSRLARILDLPYLLLAFPPLFWAGNVIVGRAVRGEIQPLSINWWRWTIGTLILLAFLHRPLWRQRAVLLRHWKLILFLSATGIVVFHSAVYDHGDERGAHHRARAGAHRAARLGFARGAGDSSAVARRRAVLRRSRCGDHARRSQRGDRRYA